MISKEEAKSRIMELVEHFKKDLESGRAYKYSEEETKVRYIQPLFEALGWDFSAKADDISLEERISGKRVDYGFRINGIPKFYVEAKKVKEDLNKIEFAEQAINYAWHKGCTWAVLTDFESLKIFNSEWKYKGDPSVNKFKEFQYWDYVERFNELWLLSKESMNKSELDKVAESVGKKIKKQPVGKQMYDDLLMWRTILSKDIVKQNPKKFDINSDELDEVVQRILDRFIFIRTVEDRGIHTGVKLIELVRDFENKKTGKITKKINELFNEYDVVFNSKLFLKGHFSEQVEISNEVLFEVIEGLYHTKDESIHYNFAAINADVLGNVYEQYLGHLLKKTEKRAKVEKSKAKRKEQGIYYTPNYIVDYIVKNTVGEYIKGKNKNTVEKVKILDPACGSGSFLIRAFDEIDMYWKRNLKEDTYKQTKFDYDGSATPISRKIEILRNNIYGVDLDEQAVEIARLNLLIKAAEKKHLLPTLDQNIKNGNSLIDDPSVAGDKAFQWAEEFEAIMKDGGFDVIIGNPPYVNIFNIKESDRNYFQKHYLTATNKSDLYSFFIEKSITKLLKNGGYLGFIISSTWTSIQSFKKLRQLLLENTIIEKIILLELGVFSDANVVPIIIIVKKTNNKEDILKNKIKIFNLKDSLKLEREIPQKLFLESTDYVFSFSLNSENNSIFNKIKHESILLGNIASFSLGVKTGNNEKFVSISKTDQNSKKVIKGKYIKRYSFNYNNEWLLYLPNEMLKKVGAGPRKSEYFEVPKKIILQEISGNKIIGALDTEQFYALDTVNILYKLQSEYSFEYILSLLNSKLINFWYGSQFKGIHVKLNELRKIPIKVISLKDQSNFIMFVTKMSELNKRLNEIGNKNTDEKMKLEAQIKKLDDEINELVYKIYGITEEEKKIIEGSLNE